VNDGEIGCEARADVDETTYEKDTADDHAPLAGLAAGVRELVIKE
jgi:hypothetical protein